MSFREAKDFNKIRFLGLRAFFYLDESIINYTFFTFPFAVRIIREYVPA